MFLWRFTCVIRTSHARKVTLVLWRAECYSAESQDIEWTWTFKLTVLILKSDPGNANAFHTCMKCFSSKVRVKYFNLSLSWIYRQVQTSCTRSYWIVISLSHSDFCPFKRSSDNIIIKSFAIHFLCQFECCFPRGDSIIT